jgi:hypothetical protein
MREFGERYVRSSFTKSIPAFLLGRKRRRSPAGMTTKKAKTKEVPYGVTVEAVFTE